MRTNYYELLEIPATASDEEIRKAIRDQRKRWSQLQGHPKLEVQHEAQLKVREVTEAEVVLTDPARRREHDLRIQPPAPTPVYEGQPDPTPVFDRRLDPAPEPWQAGPEPWRPQPPREPRISARATRWLVLGGMFLAVVAAAVAFVAPAVGAAIRRSTGHFPTMAVERYDGSFDSIVGATDRLVGASIVGAIAVVVVGIGLIRWRKTVALLALVLGLAGCAVLGLASAGTYDGEAHELVMDGMCNGGVGSTGSTTLEGRRVNYGLNRRCDALVLWSGTTEIRKISAPTKAELDLHVVGTNSRKGGYFVAAATMATDNGGPYTLVIFRLDDEQDARSFDLRAPDRGQGFPILGENGLFQFEQQTDGEGMVTAVDPDTGNFAWNATCPSEWEFLSFWQERKSDPTEVNCVQDVANGFRSYELDTETGALGAVLEDRAWRQ